jgi:hypothetical protein
MIRTFMIAAASAAVLTISPTVFGQQPEHGTAEQAKAMLLKAEVAVKADKTKALGKIVAQGNPNAKQQLGQDQRTLKDSTGKNFGRELYAAGQKPEGQITKVSYMFAKPGPDTTPVPKVTLVTRASDLVCGVGYYK